MNFWKNKILISKKHFYFLKKSLMSFWLNLNHLTFFLKPINSSWGLKFSVEIKDGKISIKSTAIFSFLKRKRERIPQIVSRRSWPDSATTLHRSLRYIKVPWALLRFSSTFPTVCDLFLKPENLRTGLESLTVKDARTSETSAVRSRSGCKKRKNHYKSNLK